MKYRIIVAHPGRQHSYRLASALKKNGMLYKYVTTVYNKDSSILMKFIRKNFKGSNLERAKGRRNPDLEDSDVLQIGEARGLIEILLARCDKSGRFYSWWQKKTADYFGRYVADFAVREKADAVVMYDTNAMTCFEILERASPDILRIMDTSAANRMYMKKIYEQDMELCPQFAQKLKQERAFLWKKNSCDRLQRELAATQLFLAPSSFVKNSLEYSGIKADQIKVCPYGSNFEPVERLYDVSGNRRLEAVYVGNVTEMKGIYYLLEAAMSIPLNKMRLTVVGEYDNRTGVFDGYMKHIRLLGRVTHDEVKKILCESDIFVFPSLGEGLSLSVLEAMACGLPGIVSKNSGANDAIIDGLNGYVVDIQNSEILREKMLWFTEHRERIPDMGRAAAQSAEKYSWRAYEARVTEILKTSLTEKKGNADE